MHGLPHGGVVRGFAAVVGNIVAATHGNCSVATFATLQYVVALPQGCTAAGGIPCMGLAAAKWMVEQ